jgi:hypothetical protein
MNDAKLEGLRRLAADERTPIEEARNAALAFVRGGGGAVSQDKAELERLAAQVKQLDDLRNKDRAETAKHKAEVERLRIILGKMLALKDAEAKLEKNKTDVAREAKEALGQAAPKPRPSHSSPSIHLHTRMTGRTPPHFGRARSDLARCCIVAMFQPARPNAAANWRRR